MTRKGRQKKYQKIKNFVKRYQKRDKKDDKNRETENAMQIKDDKIVARKRATKNTSKMRTKKDS